MIYNKLSKRLNNKYLTNLKWAVDIATENKGIKALGIDKRIKNLNSIGRLDNVEYIYFYKFKEIGFDEIPQIPSVKHILIRESDINNLDFLALFPNLSTFDCWDCGKLKSLKGIEQAREITIVNLNSCFQVKEYKELTMLKQLRYLGISGGMYKPLKLDNLKFLSAFRNLEDLNLSSVRVLDENLKPISKLKRLKNLFIPATHRTEELAYLSGALPNTECIFFKPYVNLFADNVSLGVCKKCKGKIVSLTGKGKRQMICENCDRNLIEKQVALFEKYKNEGEKAANKNF